MTEPAAPEHRVPLRRLGGLFAPHWPALVLMLTVTVATSVVGTVSPFLVRAVIDTALPRRDLALLYQLGAGLVAVAALVAVLSMVQGWISSRVGLRIMHRLRTEVFAHLQRQSLAFFTRTRAGEVQSRIANDVGGLQNVIISAASSAALQLTTAVAVAVAMAALSWRLMLISLVVTAPAVLVTRQVAALRRRILGQRQLEYEDLTVTVEESLSVNGIQLIKTLGTGPGQVARFTEISTRLVDLELRAQLAGRWRMVALNVLFSAIPAMIYVGAGYAETTTIGTVVAFTGLQSALLQPMMGLLNTGAMVSSSLALFGRVFEYMDLPVEIDDPADPVRIDPATVTGRLRFEDVTVAYPGGGAAAVAGVTIDVPAGTTLAVVGETGAGKSTLASLVPRLRDPTGGRVTLDGIDLRDLTLADLAATVGMVSQETYLLHGSVRDNLRSARPSATDAEIEAAATAAQIHDLITGLPDGYDTVVGSRGHRFSGGERQRIAIARTLLRDPRVLVLDEATSALDTATERAVQEAFDLLTRGRTTITVAHRLSTVRNADQIVVLDHGRVVETGTHAGLLGHNGRYTAFVT
ncbi:ABC transporter ATP-binding protein [Nonomuraea sp. NPDC050540]|uniref:ABC transporter ATP-binding protein n=1 Tax=Nonomuraea sp. NPDC050540 TaxID=3364367 RepID=UPI0037AEEDEE